MNKNKTICAVATPLGTGGVAIIRVSGSDAFTIAGKMVTPVSGELLTELEPHKLARVIIHKKDKPEDFLDEGLAAIMIAPNSYTGENVVEINCHGGFFVTGLILDELLLCGCALAEAGEFTRRAFLNGRIDLAGAEGISDLIHARSRAGHMAATASLKGELSLKINHMREQILDLASQIAACADFPEEAPEIELSEFTEKTEKIKKDISSLIDSFNIGRILRDGILTVITGRPNVGKSSLLNALLGEERAIVTDIAGTTRDVLSEYASLGGVELKLLDTAGIRDTQDNVEKIGVALAKSKIPDADLILFVVDISEGITEEDIVIAKMVSDKKVIVVANKSDKTADVNIKEVKAGLKEVLTSGFDIIVTSLLSLENSGIEMLQQLIVDKFTHGALDKNALYISNVRHKDALLQALEALTRVTETVDAGVPVDLCFVHLETAIAALGEITGASVQEEIIARVFENFCVGK